VALDSLVRKLVALGHKVTRPLQADVVWESWQSTNDKGAHSYAPAVALPAHIEWEQKLVRTLSGAEKVSRTHVTFLYPVPIDERDRMTLPDGDTGPILDLSGYVDPTTGHGYYTEVWLG
jgi:hypothetical protein